MVLATVQLQRQTPPAIEEENDQKNFWEMKEKYLDQGVALGFSILSEGIY